MWDLVYLVHCSGPGAQHLENLEAPGMTSPQQVRGAICGTNKWKGFSPGPEWEVKSVNQLE